MGHSVSKKIDTSEWKSIEVDRQILVNLRTRQKVRKHIVGIFSAEQLEPYRQRISSPHPHVCSIKYYHPIPGQPYRLQGPVEEQPKELYAVYSENYSRNCFWDPNNALAIVRGFKKLINEFSCFHISESLVFQNDFNETKVWINSNVAVNRVEHEILPALSQQALANQIVMMLLRNNPSLITLNQCNTFQQCITALEAMLKPAIRLQKNSYHQSQVERPLAKRSSHPYESNSQYSPYQHVPKPTPRNEATYPLHTEDSHKLMEDKKKPWQRLPDEPTQIKSTFRTPYNRGSGEGYVQSDKTVKSDQTSSSNFSDPMAPPESIHSANYPRHKPIQVSHERAVTQTDPVYGKSSNLKRFKFFEKLPLNFDNANDSTKDRSYPLDIHARIEPYPVMVGGFSQRTALETQKVVGDGSPLNGQQRDTGIKQPFKNSNYKSEQDSNKFQLASFRKNWRQFDNEQSKSIKKIFQSSELNRVTDTATARYSRREGGPSFLTSRQCGSNMKPQPIQLTSTSYPGETELTRIKSQQILKRLCQVSDEPVGYIFGVGADSEVRHKVETKRAQFAELKKEALKLLADQV